MDVCVCVFHQEFDADQKVHNPEGSSTSQMNSKDKTYPQWTDMKNQYFQCRVKYQKVSSSHLWDPTNPYATLNSRAPIYDYRQSYVLRRPRQLHRVLTCLGKCPEQSLDPSF